jgi:tellurite resistance protein
VALAGNIESLLAAHTEVTGLGTRAVLMALVQLRLIPLYVKQHFSAAFWAFTFPYAAVATDAAQWIRYKNLPGATVYAAIDVGLITAFIAAIFIRSAVAIARNQFLPPLPAKPAATTSSG